ncbi:hypothetical protein [Mucilaginibacter sp.]|uniref:tetratricopeptide repeat protein n=1 Tax=Mucilaginibacter sp. TaxID=1882438 RepID=UPI00283D0F9A|nr:hypothetical protein [Mucilaginibacter sp.]MDR3696726.1 hypothetical protein [Mucilaginibacter sp.]
MSKKKKAKVVSIKQAYQSPENYIKTQARSLPIEECVVSENWQETGICNIIVARRHKTGNLTLGIYMVDLYCLGMKDAHYKFNIDQDDYDYLKENYADFERCDYVLAHNIIYGAVAFAEDYGFKPHKDFAIAQFILEEDDDNVELMELEFGFEGIPFYIKGPNDSAAKINQIKSTLLRTAGEGNFNILEDDDGFDEDDDDGGYRTPEDFAAMLENINNLYDQYVQTKEAEEKLEKSTIGKAYQLVGQPVESVYRKFDSAGQEEHYNKLLDMVSDGQRDSAIDELKKAIVQYPQKAQFYNLLQSTYMLNGQGDKSDTMIVEMYERFPGYLFALVNYINLLLEEGKLDEVPAVLDGKADLNDWYPDRNLFNIHEAAIFYATMCRYFIMMDDIDSADLYMYPILKDKLYNVQGQSLARTVMLEIGEAKMEKIKIRSPLWETQYFASLQDDTHREAGRTNTNITNFWEL